MNDSIQNQQKNRPMKQHQHLSYPLLNLISQNPDLDDKNENKVLELFLSYVESTGISLYQAQEEAILELMVSHNVILNTPTGSGKSMVALFMHFFSMLRKRRSIYTAPIKALVNEKFLSLCHLFGPDQVGLLTGDASVNSTAPIICCTAEILSNMALRSFENTEVHDVIIDEFHYFSDRDRGTAWQVPLLTLPHCRFLLMSATMGESEHFEKALTKLTNASTITITSTERPVPLEFRYEELPLEYVLESLVIGNKSPVYLVHFTQNECATTAQGLLSVNYTSKEEKQQINKMLEGQDFRTPYGKELKRLLLHGLGIHHAGLLPKYRVLIEKLAKLGLLKIICGTDTLGVGVNIPIRTVLMTKMCKFDGEKSTLLSVRDFHQIAGRAGRRGYDEQGTVIVLAPAHVIENKKKEEKSKKNSGGKNKKLVKAKPPEKGYVPWDKVIYERILNSQAEALKSSFKVSHGMLLNVLGSPNNSMKVSGLRRMKRLIESTFETEASKKRLKQEAFVLFQSLVYQKIIEFIPKNERVKEADFLRVNLDLQEDFSLLNPLSLYLLDTLDKIDPYLEDYTLRVLTLVESIIENPKIILKRQVDKLKHELMLQLKSEGVEFEERVAKLEEVDYPKPLKDFIYDTFNEFSKNHPWVGNEHIRPKSIAREMMENFYSFNDYIYEYGLERSEGVLLRHLMEVYKVLNQTIPEKLKNEKVMDMISYIESLIREVDSGILDEWNNLKDPASYLEKIEKLKEKEEMEAKNLKASGILADLKVFESLVRNAVFHVVKALANNQLERVLESLDIDLDNEKENKNESENKIIWTKEKLESLLGTYYEEFEDITTTTEARSKKHTLIQRNGDGKQKQWEVRQKILDTSGESDYYLVFKVNLERSKKLGRPCLILQGLEQ